MRRFLPPVLIGLALVAVGMVLWPWRFAPPPHQTDAALPDACRPLTFEGEAYVVCTVRPDTHRLSIGHNDGKAKALATVSDFISARTAAGRAPMLVMNAGMYDFDLKPIGLLVEEGRTLKALNQRDGSGNFHLKPNGVFFINGQGQAGVTASEGWTARAATARYATQSGPMLVIGGKLHPAFEPNGNSRYRRNGVGVRADGTVVLAISRRVVSFGAFARLFRDALGCPDALFLDGAVSALAGPDGAVVGGTLPAGPVIVVDRRPG